MEAIGGCSDIPPNRQGQSRRRRNIRSGEGWACPSTVFPQEVVRAPPAAVVNSAALRTWTSCTSDTAARPPSASRKIATRSRRRRDCGAMAARERHVGRIVGRAGAALQLGGCRAILKDRIATRRASWHGFLFSPGGSADRPKYAEYQLRYERRHQSNHLPSIIFRLLPTGRVNCTTRSPLSATFACASASRIDFSSIGSWKGLRRIGTRAVCTTSL